MDYSDYTSIKVFPSSTGRTSTKIVEDNMLAGTSSSNLIRVTFSGSRTPKNATIGDESTPVRKVDEETLRESIKISQKAYLG